MIRRLERGAGNLDAFLILAFVIFVMLVTPRTPGTKGNFFSGGAITSSQGLFSGTTIASAKSDDELYSGYRSLSILSGNAPYEYQPYKEYIEIENWGDKPIDITGWSLRNGKDKRAYDVYGQLQRFSADIAIIPKAAPLLLPSGGSAAQDVVLGRGERAIMTTGAVAVTSPYRISSFKENSCTGYLERLPDYAFNPPLQMSCSSPDKEPGVEGLDSSCRLFIETISPCETPQFDAQDEKGDSCATCIRGERLSSSCATFIKQHFSYQGCVAYHAGDANFSTGHTWRIFLGRSWEMWAENYESIELYDRNGVLTAFQNY